MSFWWFVLLVAWEQGDLVQGQVGVPREEKRRIGWWVLVKELFYHEMINGWTGTVNKWWETERFKLRNIPSTMYLSVVLVDPSLSFGSSEVLCTVVQYRACLPTTY